MVSIGKKIMLPFGKKEHESIISLKFLWHGLFLRNYARKTNIRSCLLFSPLGIYTYCTASS
jgi:hypothetical protein